MKMELRNSGFHKKEIRPRLEKKIEIIDIAYEKEGNTSFLILLYKSDESTNLSTNESPFLFKFNFLD